MDDVITLIRQSYSYDDLGEQIPTETERDVFATITSVSREEWQTAGHNDPQSVIRAITPTINYDGETKVIYHGKTYAVYRCYYNTDGDVELYMEQQAGVR